MNRDAKETAIHADQTGKPGAIAGLMPVRNFTFIDCPATRTFRLLKDEMSDLHFDLSQFNHLMDMIIGDIWKRVIAAGACFRLHRYGIGWRQQLLAMAAVSFFRPGFFAERIIRRRGVYLNWMSFSDAALIRGYSFSRVSNACLTGFGVASRSASENVRKILMGMQPD